MLLKNEYAVFNRSTTIYFYLCILYYLFIFLVRFNSFLSIHFQEEVKKKLQTTGKVPQTKTTAKNDEDDMMMTEIIVGRPVSMLFLPLI